MKYLWIIVLLSFGFQNADFKVTIPNSLLKLHPELTKLAFSNNGEVVEYELKELLDLVQSALKKVLTLDELIILIFEEVREFILTGIPEIDLQILDPLVYDHAEVNFTHELGTFVGSVDNIRAQGLSKFTLSDLKTNAFQMYMEVNISFPFLEVVGDYEINGDMAEMFVITGKGPFWFEKQVKLTEFSVKVEGFAGINSTGKYFFIRTMDANVTLLQMENKFHNLMYDEEIGEFFNRLIAYLVPEGMNYIWPDLKPWLLPQILELLNNMFKCIDLESLGNSYMDAISGQ